LTIGDAIDAAWQGDSIWVAEGMYTERLVIEKRLNLYGGFIGESTGGYETTLSQRDWVAHVPIIDGTGETSGWAVDISTNGNNSVLDGFSVTNGTAGGIRCQNSTAMIARCHVSENKGVAGAGIYCASSSSTIDSCEIIANHAEDETQGVGGGLYSASSTLTVKNTILTGNYATNGGGAIQTAGNDSSSFIYCTMNGNSVSESGAGKSLSSSSSSPSLTNCVLWNGGDEVASTGSQPTLSHCCVHGGYEGGTNIVTGDPKFMVPWDGNVSNLRPGPGSSCLDTGVTVQSVTTDIKGYDRTDTQTPTVGAYYTIPLPLFVRPTGSDDPSVTGDSWEDAFRTIGHALSRAPENGGSFIYIERGTYHESLTVNKSVTITGGYKPDTCPDPTNDPTDEECQWQPERFKTTIHPNSGRVFEITSDGVTLKGLEITGGSGTKGGGVFADGIKDIYISNCNIHGNQATENGGGLDLESLHSISIKYSKIADNHAGVDGGGAFCLTYGSTNLVPITILGCSIDENSTEEGDGGGLFMGVGKGTLDITDTTIQKNTSGDRGGGAYILLSALKRNSSFDRVKVISNTAQGHFIGAGGGIWLNGIVSGSADNIRLYLHNSLIAKNQGGGVYVSSGAAAVFRNCTITKNSSVPLIGSGIHHGGKVGFIDSILWGNSTSDTGKEHAGYAGFVPTYSCLTDAASYQNTNTPFDPNFYRKDFDWHLTYASVHCRDAAGGYQDDRQYHDIDGNPRPSNFGTGHPDMGCYEWPDPKFFGVSDRIATYRSEFRVLPGFPEIYPQPVYLAPERFDAYLATLEDLGVRTIEVFFQWNFLEVLPGPQTTNLTYDDPVFIWDDNGEYNLDDVLGPVNADDWEVELVNPYDQWIGGPEWDEAHFPSIGSAAFQNTYQSNANLGYMKTYLKRYAEVTYRNLWKLHEKGFEVHAAINSAPAWRVTNDSHYPFANIEQIFGLTEDPGRKNLRWLTTLYLSGPFAGISQDDRNGDPLDPTNEDTKLVAWKRIVEKLETWFPFIDYYMPYQEQELTFRQETLPSPTMVDQNKHVVDYHHKECWDMLKAMKDTLSSLSDENKVYINFTLYFVDTGPLFQTAAGSVFQEVQGTQQVKFLDGLINQALPGTHSAREKVDEFKKTVDVYAQNIFPAYTGEDAFVRFEPANIAEKVKNRIEFLLDHKFKIDPDDPNEVGIPILHEVEFWIEQFNLWRSVHTDRYPTNMPPLILQQDNQNDQSWQREGTFDVISTFLQNPDIKRYGYSDPIDWFWKVPVEWNDTGLFDFHFTRRYKASAITRSLYAEQWTHPLTQIVAGDAESFDYYVGDSVPLNDVADDTISRYPAYYAYKSLIAGKTTNPEVPQIDTLTIKKDNVEQIPPVISWDDWTSYTIEVTLGSTISGAKTLLIDGIQVADTAASPAANPIAFQLSDSYLGGDQDTLRDTLGTESRYHRLSVLVNESAITGGYSELGEGGKVETGYRLVNIVVGDNDYADCASPPCGVDPIPIATWDFNTNPFPTWTPTSTNAPTPTEIPPGNPTPTYTPDYSPTPTPVTTYWHRRSFNAENGSQFSPSDYLAWATPTPNGDGAVLFFGSGKCGLCNYDRCATNAPCCDNEPASTNVPAPCWGGTPTPAYPTTGFYATPTPIGPCNWNNHECNPFCTLDNWEGAEIWEQISTYGYKNIIVEFNLFVDVDGLSTIPHGRRPYGTVGERIPVDPNHILSFNERLRPYQFCENPMAFEKCPDAEFIEEQIMVMYTTLYDPPYNQLGEPVYQNPVYRTKAGISNWAVARILSRVVLEEDQEYQTPPGKKVVLDFSMHDEIDNKETFGLWIRCQLDKQSNKVYVDNLRVLGQVMQ
jgi:hypothetical protein